jgi:hypothetical protein
MGKNYTVSQVAQDERRLDLMFTRLGGVLIEIATQSEIRPNNNNQAHPLSANPRKRSAKLPVAKECHGSSAIPEEI